jgi:hypothetical protein
MLRRARETLDGAAQQVTAAARDTSRVIIGLGLGLVIVAAIAIAALLLGIRAVRTA